ncbi:MAG: cation-transporting P-type ATPase, partial [Deltaproteobacteria bacterium]|nr:cation-transporting P-type ATPase [Deltaproteobacteria bacterium]
MVHQLPGRVRFRVPALRGSESLKTYVLGELGLSAGVRRVSASASTGSLLVHFEEQIVPAVIMRTLLGTLERFEALPPDHRDLLSGPGTRMSRKGAECDESPLTWHVADPLQVLAHFQSSSTRGLSEEEARERLHTQGRNTLPAMLPRTFAEILASQVKTMPLLLIFGAAGISVLTGRLAEGMIAMGVALLNALIGSVTEKKAEQTLEVVRESVALTTTVLRDGELREIPFDDVVEGDLLDLQTGSRVPADARLIGAEHLAVDESALTGESIPMVKFIRAHRREHLPISQQRNMLYRGTLVVEGKGRAVVVATGKNTALGRLQSFLGVVFPPEALMAKGLKRLALQLLMVAVGASALLSAVSLFRGFGLLQILKQSLSFIASAIPSSLSTVAISAFALGHRDMQRHHILVRRLRALG